MMWRRFFGFWDVAGVYLDLYSEPQLGKKLGITEEEDKINQSPSCGGGVRSKGQHTATDAGWF